MKPPDRSVYALNPFILRFRDRILENIYETETVKDDMHQARIALFVGFLFNLFFCYFDSIVLKTSLLCPSTSRLAIFALYGVCYVATLPKNLGRKFVVLMYALTILYAASYANLNLERQMPNLYLNNFLIFQMGILVLLPFDFVHTSLAVWVSSLVYLFLVSFLPIDDVNVKTLAFKSATVNFVGMFGLYQIQQYRRNDFVNLRLADAERKRSFQLLNNIFPKQIVSRLSDGDDVSDEIKEASVLFADLVNFTKFAARVGSKKVVLHLNRVFSSFDSLVYKHGLEKIKTIGDAYMVAGGVPHTQKNVLPITADLALDMMKAVKDITTEGAPTSIRIGLHTGPLIAGVIGSTRFLYDMWGSTVNMASRLESYGMPGRIHVSEAVYNRLKEEFDFEPCGEVELKGIGKVRTWFLLGRK